MAEQEPEGGSQHYRDSIELERVLFIYFLNFLLFVLWGSGAWTCVQVRERQSCRAFRSLFPPQGL